MASQYNRTVPSTLYPSIDSAIVDILSSGLQTYDLGVVSVISGIYSGSYTYLIPSGSLVIACSPGVVVDTLNFNSSGRVELYNIQGSGFNFKNGYITLSNASGNLTTSGCVNVNVYNGFAGSGTSFISCSNVMLNNYNVTNSGKLTFNNITNLSISSGIYSYGLSSPKSLFQLCSGIIIDHIQASNISGTLFTFQGCPDISINYVTLSSLVSGYAISKFEALSGVNCSGNINYSIMVGNAGSGMGPLARGDINQYINSNTSCLYNFTNQTYTGISGYYFNLDPIFVNPSGGDLRVDVNSPCACAGEYVDYVTNFGDVVVKTTPMSKEAIKFYIKDQGVFATTPSGVYVVQGGQALYIQADSNLDPNMDIVIYKQYQVTGSGLTFQSFNSVGVVGYESDYKIIPYTNYADNTTQYYIQPFTILSFSDVVSKVGGSLSSIFVSGIYAYQGFARDRYQTLDGVPYYWIGEKYNNYIYGFSALTNTKMSTYPILNASGIKTVVVPDVTVLSKSNGLATLQSSKVFVDDHYETRTIYNQHADNIFELQSFEKDQSLSIIALSAFGDNLVVLARQDFKDNTTSPYFSNNLYFYNKYDQELMAEPVAVFSGLAGLDNINVSDISFNDIGDLLVGYSGIINTYHFYYDYALVTRGGGTLKSSVLFREYYPGVNL